MRTLLIAATALAGIAGAHAATLPTQGLNAGSVSGSSASIGNAGGLPTSTTSLGALQNGTGSVVTSGNAFSTSTLTPAGVSSHSNSAGSIATNMDGTPNAGNAAALSVTRTDQAYTAGGLSLSGPSGSYAIGTSALSGQTLSTNSDGVGGGNNALITSTGNSASNASLGLPSITASANSQGSLSGTVAQGSGFSGERIDNATSDVSLAGSIGDASNGLGFNLGAEANAGHDLGLSVQTQSQAAPTVANSISDRNSAASRTTGSLASGSLTLTTASHSNDDLSGGIAQTPTNGGNYFGSSAVNAQTNGQLSGSLSTEGFQLNGGGISGATQGIN